MRKLKLLNVILVAVALASPIIAGGQESAASGMAATDRVTFYEVPLKCPAAPGLACGGRAKPVLFALERRPAVAEAWVNRSGTMLAVVWKTDSMVTGREAAISDIASLHELSFRELTEDERNGAGPGFASRIGWYRSSDTGKLSEDEAHIIAERLVRRLVVKAPTAASKTESLTPLVFDLIRADLLGGEGRSGNRAELRNRLLAAARIHLDATELTALDQALKPGFYPVGDEL